MMKHFRFALIAALSILLIASASAQVVFGGDYVQDRRGYDSAISYQHDFQPYTTSSSSSVYSPTGSFTINPVFAQTSASLPFVRSQQTQDTSFNQAFNQDFNFGENRDYNRDYSNIFNQNGRVDVNNIAGYNNVATQNYAQFGAVAQNNVYSVNQAPCITRKVHYDVKGKRNDVRFTEEICNGYSYSNAGTNNVNYGYVDVGGYNLNNFGSASTVGFNEVNHNFNDVVTDTYSLTNQNSGSASGSVSRSGFLSNRFFDWLY